MTSTPNKRNAICPSCGSRVRVSTSDEGTGCYLPAEGYDWQADLDELAGDLGSPLREALAAYIERLEAEKAEILREEADTRAAHDYCAEVKADRDRYKAEAGRWERMARVLAKRAQFFNVAPEANYFNSEEGWLAWAEKEAGE